MKLCISHPAGLALCRYYLELFRRGENLEMWQLELCLAGAFLERGYSAEEAD